MVGDKGTGCLSGASGRDVAFEFEYSPFLGVGVGAQRLDAEVRERLGKCESRMDVGVWI